MNNQKDMLDHWTMVGLYTILLVFLGEMIGIPIFIFPAIIKLMKIETSPLTDLITQASRYFMTIGTWIIGLVFIFAFKRFRPIRYIFGKKQSGNNFLTLLFCFALGVVTNGGCALIAASQGYLSFSVGNVRIVSLLIMVVAVFVQSSSEELLVRGIMLNLLMKRYNKRWVLAVYTSLFFAALHLGNPGMTPIAFVTLVLSGLLFYMMAYYLDSYWGASLFHFSWNYTQAYLLGLPNSGLPSMFSFVQTSVSTDTNRFFYDPKFGIEGSYIAAIVELLACIGIFIYGRCKKRKPLNVWEVQK